MVSGSPDLGRLLCVFGTYGLETQRVIVKPPSLSITPVSSTYQPLQHDSAAALISYLIE